MIHLNHSGPWREGFFKAEDGTALFYRVYHPVAPKKSLVIFHGFGEHSLRYEKFSQHFPDLQIAIFDLRGMGRSEGKPVYVESLDQFAEDCLAFLNMLGEQYPVNAPRWLLGHSLGGLNLMRLHVKYQVSAAGFIFSAPCFRVAVPALALKLNSWIASFAPEFVYHNPVYFRNLTHDPVEMNSYKEDPLIMHKMTSKLLNEMVKGGHEVEALPQIEFDTPAHFLLAGEDKLVRTDIAKKIFARISAPEKSIQVYEHFYHEIFNESGQAAVFQDLLKILS